MLGAEGRGGSGMYLIKTTLASVTNLTGKNTINLQFLAAANKGWISLQASCHISLKIWNISTSTGRTDRPIFKGS